MKIQKRRPECRTIEDVVLQNVGMSKEEFLCPQKEYYIDKISDVAEALKAAGQNKETIHVVGDYDADGICASAILSLLFKEKGWEHTIRLPKRFSEGYGLSDNIIDEINDGLLLTVDNGIAASDEIKKAKEKGLITIVTDHHLPDAEQVIPDADLVIDPNAIPNSAEFNGYCGAGLAYKISQRILDEGHPLLDKLETLAAIATIADVMPLVEDNRIIVQNGLKNLLTRDKMTAGLQAIVNLCQQEKYISAKNVAFKLAPMINAPGRMQDDGAEISLDILTYEGNWREAAEKANILSEMNTLRKEEKEKGLDILRKNIEINGMQNDAVLVVYQENLHEGLLGIYAGQIAEEYHRPCFVLTQSDEEGVLKGSGRSYADINIKQLLDKYAHLMVKYGGHKEAAGISVREDTLNELRQSLIKELSDYAFEEEDVVYYDLKIDAKQINLAIQNLEKFEPFGQGNPEVVFLIKDFIVTGVDYMQNGKTVKLKNAQGNAICFGMAEEYKKMGCPKVVHILGTLSKNCFRCFVNNQVEVLKIIKADAVETKTEMQKMLENLAKNN